MIYFFARDYERAADQCTFAVEADPRSLPARLCLLRSLVRLGREEAALDQARAMIRQVGASLRYTQILDSLPTSEGLLYYREGQADWMSSQIERGRPLEYQLAITFAELGDFGRAFEWLERAASAHTPAFRSVSVDPVFDPVRSEPRFQRIRSSLGLEGKLALGG